MSFFFFFLNVMQILNFLSQMMQSKSYRLIILVLYMWISMEFISISESISFERNCSSFRSNIDIKQRLKALNFFYIFLIMYQIFDLIDEWTWLQSFPKKKGNLDLNPLIGLKKWKSLPRISPLQTILDLSCSQPLASFKRETQAKLFSIAIYICAFIQGKQWPI